MTDQYLKIAEDYDRTFARIAYRPFMEAFMLYRALGDVSGRSVLDVACGTGLYARQLRQRGAAPVVGVDISEEMIRVGRAHETVEDLGITYLVEDAAKMGVIGHFDLAIAVYLLHYSPTEDVLRAMCRNIANNLKPDGRFLSYQFNPDVARTPGYYQKYGIGVQLPESLSDGDPFTFTLTIGDVVTPPLQVFYWSTPTLEAALRDAGFSTVSWITPAVAPEGIAQFGQEHWQDMLDVPLCQLIECTKA
ncbi:MAG TPA: methyltransferase domain-containing protein [Herpetosiphonaceae bacterium]